MPFSTVEEPAFREMVFELNPKYVLPSRKTVGGSRLDNLYSEKIEKTKKQIKTETKNTTTIYLTSDGWSGKDEDKSKFNSLTAHYIALPEWEMKKVRLIKQSKT